MQKEKSETCIGILGGGQLGRMVALEGRRMGFQVVQWTNEDRSGASRLSDHAIFENFASKEAYNEFMSLADVATVEFENVPSELMDTISKEIPLMPSASALSVCQNRKREKTFLADNGIPTATFKVVDGADSLLEALGSFSGEVIIKTLEEGYDGKGQMRISSDLTQDETNKVWQEFGQSSAIVEQKINLSAELSVMVVRARDGELVTYDPAENEHVNHILDVSIVPARLSEELQEQAKEIAAKVAEKLDYVGVIGVEFFLDDSGSLLVNEMAPRPHNSGHHTLDACATSQFEQLVRVVCGLPLGSTELLKPTVMLNLLGDVWPEPFVQPDWSPVLAMPGASLHLYGKREARVGRKMGHVTFVADTVDQALENALKCKKLLKISG